MNEELEMLYREDLRDRFAQAAMVAVVHPHLLSRIAQAGDVPKAVAEACYRVADAMIAERARRAQDERKAAEGGVGSAGGGA